MAQNVHFLYDFLEKLTPQFLHYNLSNLISTLSHQVIKCGNVFYVGVMFYVGVYFC